jgi:hypothetical protein
MKKAVLIGCNYQRTPNARLYGCINDVVNTSQILISKYGYLSNNVSVLRDDSNDAKVWPTRANILASLQNLVNQSGQCSEIWFQYSGHGSQMRDTNGDEADRMDEVIVPMDYGRAGFVSDDEIFNIVRNSKCRTMLIFDSCHSGSVCDLQWSYQFMNNGFTRSSLSKKMILGNPNVICLSGCKDAQTAADSFSQTQKQSMGAFTDAMLVSLAKLNFKTSVLSLYREMVVNLSRAGYTQIPLISCSSLTPVFNFNPVTPTSAVITSVMSSVAPKTSLRDLPQEVGMTVLYGRRNVTKMRMAFA